MYDKSAKQAKNERSKLNTLDVSSLFSIKKEYWIVSTSNEKKDLLSEGINKARLHWIKNIKKIDAFTDDTNNEEFERVDQILNSNVFLTKNFLRETRTIYVSWEFLKDINIKNVYFTEEDFSNTESNSININSNSIWEIQTFITFQDTKGTQFAEIILNKVVDNAPDLVKENFFYGDMPDILKKLETDDAGVILFKDDSAPLLALIVLSDGENNLNYSSVQRGLEGSIIWAHINTISQKGELTFLTEWAFKAFHDFSDTNLIKFPQAPGIKNNRSALGSDYNIQGEAFKLTAQNYLNEIATFTISFSEAIVDKKWIGDVNIRSLLNGNLVMKAEGIDALTTTDGYAGAAIYQNYNDNIVEVLEKEKYQSSAKSLGSKSPSLFGGGGILGIVSQAPKIVTSLFGSGGNENDSNNYVSVSDYEIKDGESLKHFWYGHWGGSISNNKIFQVLREIQNNGVGAETLTNIIGTFNRKSILEAHASVGIKNEFRIGFFGNLINKQIRKIKVGGVLYKDNLEFIITPNARIGSTGRPNDPNQFILKLNENVFLNSITESGFTQIEILW